MHGGEDDFGEGEEEAEGGEGEDQAEGCGERKGFGCDRYYYDTHANTTLNL